MNLRDKFAAFGVEDPDSMVHSEMTEDMPVLASLRFLHGMYAIVDRYGPPAGMVYDVGEAARERMLALGVDPADLQSFARMVSHETIFSVLYFMADPEIDSDAPDIPDLPGWALMETAPDDTLTGRQIQSLYEGMDPDGW